MKHKHNFSVWAKDGVTQVGKAKCECGKAQCSVAHWNGRVGAIQRCTRPATKNGLCRNHRYQAAILVADNLCDADD